MRTTVRHLDFFSGIGGFALGFQRAGFKTVAFCESDEFCQRVLRWNFPLTPIYGDIRDHGGLPLPRPLSRGQAPGAKRLAELVDVQPDWIVVENVAHTWRRWVPELRSEFHRIGYASVPLQLSASEVGARHLRRRVFVVAHADCEQLRKLSGWWRREGGKVAKELAGTWDSEPGAMGAPDGIPRWVDRRASLGNAVVPYAAELLAEAIMNAQTVDEQQ